MSILAMALPRVKYLRYLADSYTSVKLHLIKALVVDDIHTQKWLKDAEKPLILNFNRECKVRLKPSDFTEILSDFTLEEHNLEKYFKAILKAYSNNLFLRRIETETLTSDVNNIIEHIVNIAQSAILNGDELSVGDISKSEFIATKLAEYNELDVFEIRNAKDADRLLKSIQNGEVGL